MNEEMETPQICYGIRQSAEINELCKALAAATADFLPVHKDSENPYFKSKYADLATVIAATRGPLAKHGLSVLQFPQVLISRALVVTRVVHSSGQWIESGLELPASKPDAQGLGSAITYARRYALQSMLNIAAETDDDGNAAVGTTQTDRYSSSTDKSDKGGYTVNPTQVRAFWVAVKQGGKTETQVRSYLKDTLGIPDADRCEKTELAGKILKSNLDAAMRWALSADNLTEKLESSVDAVKLMKKVFAVANEKQIPEGDVKRVAYEIYKVTSMTQLSPEQLQGVLKWIEGVEA